MKNQNNSLKKWNVFSRIKYWWYNIFRNSKKIEEKIDNKQNTTTSASLEGNNVLEEYRKKSERYKYLMQLQNKFENKLIFESDISENDKVELEALYVEQINDLRRKIKNTESKIQKLNNWSAEKFATSNPSSWQ